MAKAGASRNAAPALGSMLVDLFLEQHVAADVPIFGTISASRLTLTSCLLHIGVNVLFARQILGRGRHMVEYLHQIEIRLAGPLVAVRKDVIILDPAFRLGEILLLAILAGKVV